MNRTRSKTDENIPKVDVVEESPKTKKKITKKASKESNDDSKPKRTKNKKRRIHGGKLKNQKKIETKEKELDETYLDIKKCLDALVESILISDNRSDIVKFSQDVGKYVQKTAGLKKELCDLYEEENNDLPEKKIDDFDNLSIDEESFAFYENNHQKNIARKDIVATKSMEVRSKEKEVIPTKESKDTNSKPQIRKQGYLIKKNGLRNKWTKRFFILEGIDLKWFADEEAFVKAPKKHKGKMELQKSKLLMKSEDLVTESPTRFIIQNQTKVLILESKDDKEKKEWIEALQQLFVV